MPGSVNGGFNSKKKSWQKAKRQREREVKKRKGVSAKHKATTTAVSGKRTKKHARKVAHHAKVAGKEQAALESAMQVETASPAAAAAASPAKLKRPAAKQLKKKRGGAKQQPKQQAAGGAGSAPEAMQE